MAIKKSKFSNSRPRFQKWAGAESLNTDTMDTTMGFLRHEQGPPRVGWLVNFRETAIDVSSEQPNGRSAVELYFLDEEGDYFKATLPFEPYFLVKCTAESATGIEEYIRSTFDDVVLSTEHLLREDTSLPNHLIGRKQSVVKLSFRSNRDLMSCRRTLRDVVRDNKKASRFATTSHAEFEDASRTILDINEEDVPYPVRVFIDMDLRAGKWYEVSAVEGSVHLKERSDMLARPDPVVFAFDIEAAKEPLMFPDAERDEITMISYMVDGRGYLITNRTYVSKDIEAFEFTPKPEYPGEFEIFNEPTEKDMLVRFFTQIREERPTVMVSFNGDFFDFPYIEKRALANGLDMALEIGFKNVGDDTYSSSYCCHLDAFAWVKRDSYLPQGSQNLKEVTKVKLGYNPHELDPEDMTPFAKEKPQKLAEYSVSDAVATYYLYMKYVHPFIFSLCTILPLNPDDVLRKGTGTLCEMLLMVQAYQKNILLPHKHSESTKKFYDGHLIESETYSGGHVECLEPGVFRNDLCYDFKLDPGTVQRLIDDLEPALKYTIQFDANTPVDQIENFDEIKDQIQSGLEELRDRPVRSETPYIYHLDVASMYPNIMTTNRLQPDSMVTEDDCEKCYFHQRDKTCARKLTWKWRGEYYNAQPGDYRMIEQRIREQRYPLGDITNADGKKEKLMVAYDDLPTNKQHTIFRERVKEYSKHAHSKAKTTEEKEVEAIVCQRENPFYINTVRDFKDRRINFKRLQKQWKGKVDECENLVDKEEAKKMVVLYDSMQLAHKVILNSFYGYVKRTGSRWYSAEMAGVTCYTGSKIIQEASELIKGLGRPLELDTDGIWCIIPSSFPADVKFKLKNGKSLKIEYPGVILNYMVQCGYTNPQYQTLRDTPGSFEYDTTSENSIFFEVDGPYRAMILPTSLEEDVNIKKRYAVFDMDGSISELKGFELKRRGELEIVKKLQGGLFAEFLKGSTLQESYAAAAKRAGSWLQILESEGAGREDSDLLSLISEEKSMSRPITEYGSQKSTTITAARRIAEFLGASMIARKGLNARYIISKYPRNTPVTERAVPVAIFSAPEATRNVFLRKWLVNAPKDDFDLRKILDWDYYKKRLQVVIQKIITVPAALQSLPNPLPRVEHPTWLGNLLRERTSTKKQRKIGGFFTAVDKETHLESQSKLINDIEDSLGSDMANGLPTPKRSAVVTKRKRSVQQSEAEPEGEDINIDALEPPNPMENYSNWLMFQKRVWARQREQRKNYEKLFGRRQKVSQGVRGMIESQAERAFSSNQWEIVQFSPTSVPGRVLASIHVNGRLQSVKINVPRRIYVEFSHHPERLFAELPNDIAIEKVNHTLPSGVSSPHLYQMVMPESVFERERLKASCFLKSPLIAGVYETQIEPHERAMLDLGNACQLDDSQPGLLGKGLDSGFEISWLSPSPPELSAQYLRSAELDVLHVQHHEVSGQVFLVMIPSWGQRALVLHYHLQGQVSDALRLNSTYRDIFGFLNDRAEEQPYYSFAEEMDFDEEQVNDNRRLFSRASKLIVELQAQRSTRTLVLVESARPHRLLKLVRPLNELPTIQVVPSAKALPTVGWQSQLAKAVVKSYFRSQSLLRDLTKMAALTNVPVGNIMHGEVRRLIDIVYARKLSGQRNVLWWSPSPLPDYGGLQLEPEYCFQDEIEPPAINNEGLYAEVCVDVDISNFAVNTILSTNFQGLVDGADSVAESESRGVPFMREAFSGSGLNILSSLVRDWWGLVRDDNQPADLLLQHFYSWVSSPSSLLYDRRLHYHVENLSKGIFMQLTSVIRRLGYKIVMANRSRVVVSTNKSFFSNAFSAGRAIIEGIKQYDSKINPHNTLFAYLDLTLQEHWDFLIWLDEYNHSGRVTSSDLSSAADELETDHVSVWNISDYLPPLLREEFKEWVIQFMQLIGDKKDKICRESEAAVTQSINASKSLMPSAGSDDAVYFAAGVLDKMSKPLVNRIKQLHRRYTEGISNRDISREFEFPRLAGSNPLQTDTNPILELIKDLCAVFGIDKSLEKEFFWLRRRMLEVVRVGEFESRAQFVNPSQKMIVHNVVCEHCSNVTDIDVCQPELATATSFVWHCNSCGNEFNRVYVEERLIQKLMHELNQYQSQDLKCVKCGRIRSGELAQFCQCSGTYATTYARPKMRHAVQLYGQLARYYNLRFLVDAVAAISRA